MSRGGSVTNVVHYHGTPVWGGAGDVHRIAVSGAGAFVSYARPDQLAASFRHAAAVAIDNGAFSAWKRGLVINWSEFYEWLIPHYHNPKLSFFVIPDVIEGGARQITMLLSPVCLAAFVIKLRLCGICMNHLIAWLSCAGNGLASVLVLPANMPLSEPSSGTAV